LKKLTLIEIVIMITVLYLGFAELRWWVKNPHLTYMEMTIEIFTNFWNIVLLK